MHAASPTVVWAGYADGRIRSVPAPYRGYPTRDEFPER